MSKSALVYPIFVKEGRGIAEPIPSLDGQFRYSPDMLQVELEKVREAGVPAVLLFGLPAHKDECGSGAWDDEGAVQQALRLAKRDFPELYLITDVCMCEYTSHGHCGILNGREVDNDRTLELLAKTALSHARRRGHGRALRHDGRPDSRAAPGARRRGLFRHADHVLCGQIRLRLLRALPRRGGLGARLRRPAGLPDGLPQCPGSGPGGGPRRGAGGGRPDGEARALLSRRGARGQVAVRPAAGRLQRQRGIRDDPGGGEGGPHR